MMSTYTLGIDIGSTTVKIAILDENEKLLIQTGEDKYPDVMGKAVNIFSRVGEGCELSFCGFCVE